MIVVCKHCGKENWGDRPFCLGCGADLPKEAPSDSGAPRRTAAAIASWQNGELPLLEPRVFVCHSSYDRDFVVSEIVDHLERSGFPAWYTPEGLARASDFDRGVEKVLGSCKWFVLVLSSLTMMSERAKRELFWAVKNRAGWIIPVVIRDCDAVQFYSKLARREIVDFRDDVPAAQEELLRVIAGRAES
jgi:hypothetical protein